MLTSLGFSDELERRPPPPPSTRLGDWHAKPLEVEGEHLVLCTSELSLLCVIVPAADISEFPVSVMQALGGLLRELGVPANAVEREQDQMLETHFVRSKGRSMLAHLNSYAEHVAAQFHRTKGPVYLGRVAEHLADLPAGSRGFRQPRELALELLAGAG